MEKGYKNLEIFKLSCELAIEVHRMTLTLPKFEMCEEGSQIRRSSKSVPANIVEGYCLRRHKNEYLQFLHRALGSCEETSFHLTILYEAKPLQDESLFNELSDKYDRLGKMLFRFIESVMQDHLPPKYVREPSSECEE